MNNPIWVYWVLQYVSYAALLLILYALSLGAIYELRERKEGVGYQVARSAQHGEIALIGAILIATEIIKRGGVVIPEWLTRSEAHAGLLAIAFILGTLGCLLTFQWRSAKFADLYHDLVVAPIFLYLAVTLAPVIYYGGTAGEKFSAICISAFWACMVFKDVREDRMNQRLWLGARGLEFDDR